MEENKSCCADGTCSCSTNNEEKSEACEKCDNSPCTCSVDSDPETEVSEE